jgi:alkaline phosphatase
MTLKRSLLAAAVLSTLAVASGAQTIYPLTRADILAGAKFDLKVEFDHVVDPAQVKVTLNGKDARSVLGKDGQFIEREDGKDVSSWVLRDASLKKPGAYEVTASDGTQTRSVKWTVYATAAKPEAKNVILFIGDGFSIGHRTAARILTQPTEGGKYTGQLAVDDMPYMALISTQGTDSIITDSANSAHAYTTGHKSCVNALGVYCSRAANTLDHPKVETITELAKKRGLAVGVVTNSEIEDATPASMVAHTRRRSDYNDIVDMFYASGIDVMMGGGSPNFLPKSNGASKRKDEVDYIERFKSAGYTLATTKTEMLAAADNATTHKLLGLYNTGNVDGALDLKFLKKGSVAKFPDQPDVPETMNAALKILSRNKKGFVLMVESARIDKYSHSLDAERAIYDTIMLDQAVKQAQQWSKAHGNNTLILVTADHSHVVGVIGTVDDNAAGPETRNKLGVYAEAGFPNYPAPNAEGYPDKVDVSRRVKLAFGSFPDHYDSYAPHMDGEFVPAIRNSEGVMVANEKYNVAGAELRRGNLPNKGKEASNSGVHSGDDVVLTAMGPGAQRVHGHLDNSEVFRIMAQALALAPEVGSKPATAKK